MKRAGRLFAFGGGFAVMLASAWISLGAFSDFGDKKSDRTPSGQASRAFPLKEVLVIGAENAGEAYLFRLPRAVRINDKGEIFVLDTNPYEVRKFSPDGKSLAAFGRTGQAPGEIGAAQDFVLDGRGNVVVLDFGNFRLTRFDPQGKSLDPIKVDVLPLVGAAGDDGFLYILSPYGGKLIHKLDPAGRIVRSFMDERKVEPPRIVPHVNQSGRLAFREGRVYAVMAFPYGLHVFDMDGNPVTQASLPGDFPKKPYIYPDNTVVVNFQVRSVDLSKNGLLFIARVFFEAPPDLSRIGDVLKGIHQNTTIDVFDRSGKPLGSIASTGIEGGFTFGPAGRAYAIRLDENGLCQVVVYNLE